MPFLISFRRSIYCFHPPARTDMEQSEVKSQHSSAFQGAKHKNSRFVGSMLINSLAAQIHPLDRTSIAHEKLKL